MERILIVDDVIENIALLKFELEDDGFEVLSAQTGEDCLLVARSMPKPSLILLDINMPGMSGIDTLTLLKRDDLAQDIPVIMVSANDSDENIIKAIDIGAHDFVKKPIDYPVLAARMRSALRLARALDALEKANIDLNDLATKDSLTGAFNRRHFFSLARREAVRAIRYKSAVAIMMIDIDHFKHINDTYGHAAGDIALTELSKCCQTAARSSDIFGRIGGEEFALCCPECDISGAKVLAERLRSACEGLRIELHDAAFSITLSIGITMLNTGESFEKALQRADKGLYQAKEQGRNRVVVN